MSRADRGLRILVLHSTYLTGPASGENRVVDDETRLLRERGHSVVAWTPDPSTDGRLGAARLGARAIWSREASHEVRRAIARVRPDVLHIHNLFPMLSPAVIRTARTMGIPVVLTLHNFRLLCLPASFLRNGRPCEDCLGRLPWPGVVHACYRGSRAGSASLAASISLHRATGTFDEVDLFLAVSRLVRDKHVEAGIAPDRIALKPNFAWSAPRQQGSGEYFLYLGRLSPEKGPEVLIEGWRGVDAPLVVAGGGDLLPSLQAMAPPSVKFLGSVQPPEALRLLGGARALIVPSICYEGAPRSIAEAYAAGVPVVASRIGSLPEFVEQGVSGLLVPPGDPAALAEAARQLLDDGRSAGLGEGALDLWRKRFTPDRGAADLEAAYARAIERAASEPAR